MNRKLPTLLITLIMITGFCFGVVSASAETANNAEITHSTIPLLVDEADLLNEKEENNIKQKLEDFSEKHEIELAIITVSDYDGYDLYNYAAVLYSEYEYGYGKNRDGALLLRYENNEIDDREIVIYSRGKGAEIFTDDYIEKTFDAMQSDIESKKYESAFSTYVEMASEGAKHSIDPVVLFVFVLVGMVIGAVVIKVIISKNKSVARKNTANLYTRQGSMNVTEKSDVFIRSHITKTERVQKESRSSSGGSRKI